MNESGSGRSILTSVKTLGLPFLLGVAVGTYVIYGAGQDQIASVSALAPVAVAVATVASEKWYGVGVILNGLAFVLTAGALRHLWTRRRWLSVAAAILLGFWVLAPFLSSSASRRLHPYTETVMTPGMRITATTPNGVLTITAGQGTRRTYSGSGWKKSLSLIARSGSWNGSLGLYDPAESFFPNGRLLPEEGQIHLISTDQALGWLRGRGLEASDPGERPIYTNNGLVLCYSVRPVPGTGVPTATIDLWQLYIDGRRPRELPGADDSAFRIEGGTIPETPRTALSAAR